MKKIVRYWVVAVVLILLVSFVGLKLRDNQQEVRSKVFHKDPDLSVNVQADTVQLTPLKRTVSFLGSFAPSREVTVSTETTGKVITVGVQEGSRVSAGSLVAQLDTELLQAQLQSAIASYDNAVSTLNRYEQAASGVTRLQIDNARTQQLTAKAQIDQLKKQISMCTIRAPFSGIITKRSFDLGAVVGTGAQMAQLSSIDQLKLEITVPESHIIEFRKGQQLEVVTDVYAGKKFTGRVDMVAVQADASHNYMVKVLVDNTGDNALKAGMYGRVASQSQSSLQGISVPRTALVGSSKQPQVFVIGNNIAHLRNIEAADGNESVVEVTRGLQPGEVVVTGGIVNLVEGSKVSIAR